MPSPEEISAYQERLQIYRESLGHYLKQQATFGEAYAPVVISHGIKEARQSISKIKETLREWGVFVSDHPDDIENSAPLRNAGIQQPSVATLPDKDFKPALLRQLMTEYFSTDELRDIAFEMGIDYENLPGHSKGSIARELIAYVQRRGQYAELVRITRQLRPNLSVWENQ